MSYLDNNEKEHSMAYTHFGDRFATDMEHKECTTCDVVSGKRGRALQHEFLEFNHQTGSNVPRNLGHSDCPQCDAGNDHLDMHMLKNADVSVGKDGSMKAVYKRTQKKENEK